eukprot:CAMPEP_0198560456 /NCGR_PEP_ID=MMETSP1462-20131121/93987_1 /TAXON_ID=1333877 /ORGANISM="Brandtodinium nutriculum, Strain RCC3387" /LENGTH=517 /DNA_ID=CAMNT_0044291323 /DNA_START=33 /DNA_END=1583 /DNA_ORIENTATION=-
METETESDTNSPESGNEDSEEDVGRKMTSFELCSNVLISLTGTVVLGIGSKMQQGGWVMTPLMLVVGTAVISEMVWVVSTTIDNTTTKDRPAPRSYKEYIGLALGRPGELVSAVTSTFSLFSMICGGLIVLAQNMEAIMPLPQAWGDGQKWWALFLTAETLVFVFVDIGDLLDKAAWLGPFVTAGVFIMVFWGCANALLAKAEIPEACIPSAEYTSMWTAHGFGDGMLSLAQLGSYSIFVFAIVVTVPTLKSQTAKPRRVVHMSLLAFAIATMLFVALMVTYYAAFGNIGPENVIQGMKTDRPAGWWATVEPWRTGKETHLGKILATLVNVHLCLSDVVYVGCTVVAFEALFPRKYRHGWRVWITVRVFITVARTLVATLITSFTTLSSLTGSLFVVLNNILLPILGFWAVGGSKAAGPGRMLAHAIMFTFAVYMVGAGTWGSIQNLVTHAHNPPKIGCFPRPGISEACKAAYVSAGGSAAVVRHMSARDDAGGAIGDMYVLRGLGAAAIIGSASRR